MRILLLSVKEDIRRFIVVMLHMTSVAYTPPDLRLLLSFFLYSSVHPNIFFALRLWFWRQSILYF